MTECPFRHSLLALDKVCVPRKLCGKRALSIFTISSSLHSLALQLSRNRRRRTPLSVSVTINHIVSTFKFFGSSSEATKENPHVKVYFAQAPQKYPYVSLTRPRNAFSVTWTEVSKGLEELHYENGQSMIVCSKMSRRANFSPLV